MPYNGVYERLCEQSTGNHRPVGHKVSANSKTSRKCPKLISNAQKIHFTSESIYNKLTGGFKNNIE